MSKTAAEKAPAAKDDLRITLKINHILKEDEIEAIDEKSATGFGGKLKLAAESQGASNHWLITYEGKRYDSLKESDMEKMAGEIDKKFRNVLEVYERELKRHDWFYKTSEDEKVKKEGAASEKRLEELKQAVSKEHGEEKANKLWKQYQPKEFGGELQIGDKMKQGGTTMESASIPLSDLLKEGANPEQALYLLQVYREGKPAGYAHYDKIIGDKIFVSFKPGDETNGGYLAIHELTTTPSDQAAARKSYEEDLKKWIGQFAALDYFDNGGDLRGFATSKELRAFEKKNAAAQSNPVAGKLVSFKIGSRKYDCSFVVEREGKKYSGTVTYTQSGDTSDYTDAKSIKIKLDEAQPALDKNDVEWIAKGANQLKVTNDIGVLVRNVFEGKVITDDFIGQVRNDILKEKGVDIPVSLRKPVSEWMDSDYATWNSIWSFKKGGTTNKLSASGKEKFQQVMREWKDGELHHGTTGEIVRYPERQDMAIAIAFSEARKVDPQYGYDRGGELAELYQGVFGDIDDDGIANADDPNPTIPGDKHTVEDVKLSDEIQKLLNLQVELENTRDEIKAKLQQIAPEAIIKVRAKSPYSIINKLRRKALLLSQKNYCGVVDLVGGRILVDSQVDVERMREEIQGGALGKLIEFVDFYSTHNFGYRSYHFVIEHGNIPVEIQLRTKNLQLVYDLVHQYYKAENFDARKLENVTHTMYMADMGEITALKKSKQWTENPNHLKIALGIYDELERLPQDHDKYFEKTPETVEVKIADLEPTLVRESGVVNAVEWMKGAAAGQGKKRKPIVVQREGDKFKVVDGNSTFTVAEASGWSTIPAEVKETGGLVGNSLPKMEPEFGVAEREVSFKEDGGMLVDSATDNMTVQQREEMAINNDYTAPLRRDGGMPVPDALDNMTVQQQQELAVNNDYVDLKSDGGLSGHTVEITGADDKGGLLIKPKPTEIEELKKYLNNNKWLYWIRREYFHVPFKGVDLARKTTLRDYLYENKIESSDSKYEDGGSLSDLTDSMTQEQTDSLRVEVGDDIPGMEMPGQEIKGLDADRMKRGGMLNANELKSANKLNELGFRKTSVPYEYKNHFNNITASVWDDDVSVTFFTPDGKQADTINIKTSEIEQKLGKHRAPDIKRAGGAAVQTQTLESYLHTIKFPRIQRLEKLSKQSDALVLMMSVIDANPEFIAAFSKVATKCVDGFMSRSFDPTTALADLKAHITSKPEFWKPLVETGGTMFDAVDWKEPGEPVQITGARLLLAGIIGEFGIDNSSLNKYVLNENLKKEIADYSVARGKQKFTGMMQNKGYHEEGGEMSQHENDFDLGIFSRGGVMGAVTKEVDGKKVEITFEDYDADRGANPDRNNLGSYDLVVGDMEAEADGVIRAQHGGNDEIEPNEMDGHDAVEEMLFDGDFFDMSKFIVDAFYEWKQSVKALGGENVPQDVQDSFTKEQMEEFNTGEIEFQRGGRLQQGKDYIVYRVNKEKAADFFNRYPKIKEWMQRYAPQGDMLKGYRKFINAKEKLTHEEYVAMGFRPEEKKSEAFGEKTFYHVDWNGVEGWAELYQYLFGLDKLPTLKDFRKSSFADGGIFAAGGEAHILPGKKVELCRYMQPDEADINMWSKRSMVIQFTDGTIIYAVADHEGNDAGAWYVRKKGKLTRGFDGYPTTYSNTSNDKKWEAAANKDLKGATVVRVFEKPDYFDTPVTAIEFDNGVTLFPSSDDEGNSAGVIFGQTPNDESFQMQRGGTPENFDAALKNFMTKLQALVDEHYKNNPQFKPTMTAEPGRRYVRIVTNSNSGTHRSAHSFIDTENGDILKADGWKKPAKHARGNIYNENPLQGVSIYGAAYLKEEGGVSDDIPSVRKDGIKPMHDTFEYNGVKYEYDPALQEAFDFSGIESMRDIAEQRGNKLLWVNSNDKTYIFSSAYEYKTGGKINTAAIDKFVQERTRSIDRTMYHGMGDGDAQGWGNDLGSGIYWADTEDYASVFGETVKKARIQMNNVLYIDGDEDTRGYELNDLAKLIIGKKLTDANKEDVFDYLKKNYGIKGIRRTPSDDSEKEFVDWTLETKKYLE